MKPETGESRTTIMENVIANLDSKLSPQAMAAGHDPALRTGRVSFATDIFKQFTEDEATKVNLLRKMAGQMTIPQFEDDVKAAMKLADDFDRMNGFTEPPGAKGRDKYGPKRAVLIQRMSEARQVFGMLKIDPVVIQDMGFFQALETSRKYLKEHKINYRGESLPDEDSRNQSRFRKVSKAALEAAQEENPQDIGEDIKSYMARIASAAEENMQEQRQKAFEEDVTNTVKRLIEKNTVEFVDAVALTILAQSDVAGIERHIAELQKVIERKQNQPKAETAPF